MTDLHRDARSGLLVPTASAWRCGKCNTDRKYLDAKRKVRCWNCEHPTKIIEIMKREKIERLAHEQSAVDDFIAEDDDIMAYNFRHFGQRIS